MELAGIFTGLVSTTATFAFNVSQLIAEFEIAGDEFEDIVWYFTITRTALSHLKYLFKNNPLPSTQMLEYTGQIREHQKTLDSIEVRLRKIQQSLKSESFISRLAQKRDLLSGDLRRLTNKISALNGSLNLMATTYSCTVSCLVRDDISRFRADVSSIGLGPIFQSIKMDINLHYVETIETQQRSAYMGQDLEAASTLPTDHSRGIRLAATTGAVDLDRYTPDSKRLKLLPGIQAKETQQTKTPRIDLGMGRISHSNPRGVKDEVSRPLIQNSGGNPLDLLDMHTTMDEAWRMWEQGQGVGSS